MSRPTAYERAEQAADRAWVERSLGAAVHSPVWAEGIPLPEPVPALIGTTTADLLVVGGGYTGLWTALLAKEADPVRDVVLLEGRRCGWAASGRNGGFVEPSLTHGAANGRAHLPDEADRLEELGRENLAALAADVRRLGIDCDLEEVGVVRVAVEEHQVEPLREEAEGTPGARFLDRQGVQAEIASPLFLAGVDEPEGALLVNPLSLALGLRRACLEAGVRIHEDTPVRKLAPGGDTELATTDQGSVRARQVVLATNAFPSLLPAVLQRTVPVYDYAIATEPLSPQQWGSLGWERRQGLADVSNRFHYVRPTPDGRILFGGYDAVLHKGPDGFDEGSVRPETFERLAAHFAATFPQLGDVTFTHAWGGAIDVCSRFFSWFERPERRPVVRVSGLTGLGVAATRFAGRVCLDLLSGEETELTGLELVRSRPRPFPPEPLRSLGVELTVAALAEEDRTGRRGPLLRTLDALGMGFDT